MKARIRPGSEGRAKFSMRPAPQVSNQKVGIRLDFSAVQITKLAPEPIKAGGFGVVPGGYVEEEDTGFAAVAGGYVEGP